MYERCRLENRKRVPTCSLELTGQKDAANPKAKTSSYESFEVRPNVNAAGVIRRRKAQLSVHDSEPSKQKGRIHAAGSSAMPFARLRRVAGVLYTLVFTLLITLVTFLLIDGAGAVVVAIWTILQLDYRVLIHFMSETLRTWFSIFMGHLEQFGRLSIVLTGDSLHPNETALVICNHRSWADTVVIYSLARQVRMHGDVKFLAKRPLLLFPVYGFAGWVLDVVIFIKRQSDSAGRRMTKMFSSLTDPRRNRAPYWLISYLEGTRFTQKKMERAVEFAKKRDLKVLEHVLQPRTKGFISTVQALRGSAAAVYDFTIGYKENEKKEMSPTFRQMYFTPGTQDRVIHVHQRRIPLSEVPHDEEELKKWIYKLYEQKDELLRGFRRTGRFEGRIMRWNRITWGYWVRCQMVLFGAFFTLLYSATRVARFIR